jgi:hypothetical protein
MEFGKPHVYRGPMSASGNCQWWEEPYFAGAAISIDGFVNRKDILKKDPTENDDSNNSILAPVFVQRKAFVEQLPGNDRGEYSLIILLGPVYSIKQNIFCRSISPTVECQSLKEIRVFALACSVQITPNSSLSFSSYKRVSMWKFLF